MQGVASAPYSELSGPKPIGAAPMCVCREGKWKKHLLTTYRGPLPPLYAPASVRRSAPLLRCGPAAKLAPAAQNCPCTRLAIKARRRCFCHLLGRQEVSQPLAERAAVSPSQVVMCCLLWPSAAECALIPCGVTLRRASPVAWTLAVCCGRPRNNVGLVVSLSGLNSPQT